MMKMFELFSGKGFNSFTQYVNTAFFRCRADRRERGNEKKKEEKEEKERKRKGRKKRKEGKRK